MPSRPACCTARVIDVEDIRHVRMKALERALGHFRVESARAHLVVGEVVEQCASDRCLADTSFVCAYQYDCGLCHDAHTAYHTTRLSICH